MSDEPIDISIDYSKVPEGELPQCPLCGGEWFDDAFEAPTWEPGVYEGTDSIAWASNTTGTLGAVRRRWRITVEVDYVAIEPSPLMDEDDDEGDD